MIIDQILNHEHTESEWLDLQKQFNTLAASATKEELDRLEESGVGEMLYMICSGFEFEEKK